MARETSVMTMSTGLHAFQSFPCFLPSSRRGRSPQPELDGDLDEHVDRSSESTSGREPPLTDRLDRTLIKAGAQTLDDANCTDTTVALDHDFEDHVTRQASSTGVVRVLGLHFLQDGRRRDTRTRPIRSAARPAAGAVADAWTCAFSKARSAAATGTPAGSRTLAGAREPALE